jgi:hypothetical protein
MIFLLVVTTLIIFAYLIGMIITELLTDKPFNEGGVILRFFINLIVGAIILLIWASCRPGL